MKTPAAVSMRIGVRMTPALAIALALAPLSSAQTAPSALRFEVASIRPVPPGPPVDNPSFIAYRAGQASSFCMTCISGVRHDNYGDVLLSLVSTAYRIDARLIVAPDWVNRADTRFAIRAVMPKGYTREQIPDMLRALLEERFHIVVHRATVENTGYALVVAKNGPKLKKPRDLDRSLCDEWGDALGGAVTANQICRTTQLIGDRQSRITMMTNSAWGPLFESVTNTGETMAGAEVHSEYFRITMPLLAKFSDRVPLHNCGHWGSCRIACSGGGPHRTGGCLGSGAGHCSVISARAVGVHKCPRKTRSPPRTHNRAGGKALHR